MKLSKTITPHFKKNSELHIKRAFAIRLGLRTFLEPEMPL